VASDTLLSEAAALLSEHKIGCLPVVDSGQLVGILTEGDLLSMLAAGESPDS
jgi:CBS domain-containing protein